MNEPISHKPLKTSRINNRRYLGNKYKLLPFIREIVETRCQNVHTFADIFSGTGAVASAFTDRVLITNDLMYSNFVTNYAWFGAMPYRKEVVREFLELYNARNSIETNYMTENFSGTYFSLEDCSKIGFIREDIERNSRNGTLNERERALLITSLLYAMDRIAMTCGHYDAYRKGAVFDGSLELQIPQAEVQNNPENKCFNEDANDLVKHIQADLVYIDPPYNSRQYCDTYHLLENVAHWEKPEVFGVARKMDRSHLKSRYCTRSAPAAFEELIRGIRAKYILFSYNNMAEKGNNRSNAKISDEAILRTLSKKGTVEFFSEQYKAFTTGKSDISGHEERLFLCTCFE